MACQRPPICHLVFNRGLDFLLMSWVIYTCWTNLTCECATRMFASTLVDKVDMWLSVSQTWLGVCLPFRQRLLFAVMLNQQKLAVACNVVMLLLSVALCMRMRRLTLVVANLLLAWALFSGFEFDLHSGKILKLSAQQYQELLYLVAVIGGLHVKKQQSC